MGGLEETYRRSLEEPEAFWAEAAAAIDWDEPWQRVLDDSRAPFYRWFTGARMNTSYNALDRHVDDGRADQPALIYDSPVTDTISTFTYRELRDAVARFAGALAAQGVGRGDRVVIYMPLVPEAAVAMLACARIGAVHSVVFGGFSAEALRDRIQDAEAKCLITATSGYRRGTIVPLKKTADAAVADCPSITNVVVVMRRSAADEADDTLTMQPGRDRWYHELMQSASADCPPAFVDSEHMLYTLYTSGTTGGYLTECYATCKWVFDLKDSDIYWCTADIGWVTGHSYVVYGPLACGATVFVYEGAPDWPKQDRFWALIEKHKISIFYTAPTAIRAFMKWGRQLPQAHD